jgi:pilus assembly protein CpaB
VRDAGKPALVQAPGTAVRRNVTAGEPISAENLFTPGRGTGFMAAMVSPGMKAIGVTVTAASTASGFVLPGDLVDVVLTVDLRRNDMSLPGGGRYASEVILRDVRVLAVDQTLTPGSSTVTGVGRRPGSKSGAAQAKDDSGTPGEVAMVGKTVALEVTPADGERLLAAQAAGTLSLALRSLAIPENKEDPNSSFVSDVDSSRALRMAVGGGVKVIKGGTVAH